MSTPELTAGTRWRSLRQQFSVFYLKALHSDFLHKVAETFGTRVLLIGIGLITGVIVTRTLGPEGRGLYATAVTIGAIGVQFGNLGLHASNTYYVAQDRALLPALLGNSLLISFGLGGLGAGLTWLLFDTWPALAPLHGTLLGLALLWAPLGLAYLLVQNLLLGTQEVRAYNGIELATRLLSVGLIGTVIWLRAVSPTMIFVASFLTIVVGLLLGVWRLSRQLVGPPSFSRGLFQQGLHYGFKAYLGAFFAYMVLRIDLLMVKQMLGSEQAGYYSIATNMADMVYMLPVVVGSLLFPRLTAMSDPMHRWRYTRQVVLLIGLVMLVVASVAGSLAQLAVGILYGPSFLPSVLPFVWLMPAIVLMSINTILMNYFAASGMPLITVYSPAIAALVNIALNLWLLPRMGVVGASFSSIAAYGLMVLFSLGYVFQYLKESVHG